MFARTGQLVLLVLIISDLKQHGRTRCTSWWSWGALELRTSCCRPLRRRAAARCIRAERCAQRPSISPQTWTGWKSLRKTDFSGQCDLFIVWNSRTLYSKSFRATASFTKIKRALNISTSLDRAIMKKSPMQFYGVTGGIVADKILNQYR